MVENTPSFNPERLTACSLYRLTDFEPIFLENIEEGDIAYYGLILQSEYDVLLKNYLLERSTDRLWEYQQGYGVTSADSALVIEGLLESGVDQEILKKSAERLVALYYSERKGAFKTVLEGRAMYWRGVSTETTAHIAYLLIKIDFESYAEKIYRCAEYIQDQQDYRGFWTGKWFPSVMIPTYHSVRFLNEIGSSYSKNIDRAQDWIVGRQAKNGNWMNSVIDSSAAILALMSIGGSQEVCEKGKKWLLAKKREDRWEGEPVLYYWFEESHDKIFFCCRDKGKITTAWAKLALSALGQDGNESRRSDINLG